MSPEVLRRLAIDRSLGELSDDAAALLDAYVAEHPNAASALTEGDDALSLARSALALRSEATDRESMPPLRLDGTSQKPLAETPAHTRPIFLWSRRTAVAASIVIAFLLGTRSAPQSTKTGPASQLLAAGERTADPSDDESGFWSIERLISRDAPQPRQSNSQLNRSSPWTLLPPNGEQS